MYFDFPQRTRSVGMFFGNDDTCCTAGFTTFLDIYDNSGLLDTIGVQANMNDYVDQFLGFNSVTPVTSVRLRYGTGEMLASTISSTTFNSRSPSQAGCCSSFSAPAR